MKKNQSDVLEVEAEEMLPEVPLEKVIETALIKANVTDQVIAKLQETYGGMKLVSLEDKEGYIDIKDARREVRKVGILTEKMTKKGREDAVRVQRLWLDKEKEILGKIAKVQDPLDVEIKKFEDEVDRKEKEEQQKKDEQNIKRQAQLSKYGAVYSNGNFELKHISYESEVIKNADEEMWNEIILPKFKKVYDDVEAEKVSEENKRKEAADKLKSEQDKLEEDRRLFKEQQDLLKKQQDDLQKQKDDADRQQRLDKERKDDEEAKRKQSIIDDRSKQLNTVNINRGYNDYVYIQDDLSIAGELKEEGITIPFDLSILSDTEWMKIIEQIRPLFDKKKKEVEEKRLAKIEEDKQAAIKKALDDKKESDRLAEVKRQQDLDALNDKEKYEDTVSYLLRTPIHKMKSSIYKSKMNSIKDFISDLKN